MRITLLLICSQPPAVLQPAGVGAGAGGAGTAGVFGLLSRGTAAAGSHIWSTEAYWINPISSKPVGIVCDAGTLAGAGGTAGFGNCACAPVAHTRASSRITRATPQNCFAACA